MPNYEYECSHCSHKFIEFQSMSEDRLVKCPECKKEIPEGSAFCPECGYHIPKFLRINQGGN